MSAATKPNGRGPRVPLAVPQAPESVLRTPYGVAPTPSLDAAVLRVQATAPKLIRNAIGQVGSRTYGYTTNDLVVDTVLPLLVEESLLWRTFPTALDGEPALRYRMTHVPTGEYDEDTMLLLCDRTSQGQGSGDTYARRYSLVAYLNLTVDPDDDGLSANAPPPRDRYAEAEAAYAESGSTVPSSPQPSARAPQPSERRITANQREKLLKPRAQKAGLTSGQFANVILTAQGEPTRTWTSQEHADQTLDRLLDQLEVRYKDAVLSGIDQAQVAKLAGSGKR